MINFFPVICITQFGPCPTQYLSARNLGSLPEIQSLKILNSISSFSNSRLVGQLNNSVLSFNLNSIQVSVSTAASDSSWLASLQQLIVRSRIDGKLPHRIDLRFSHPIVTY